MKLLSVALVSLCLLGSLARADAEHDRIFEERNAANAKLAEHERECATRFIVADCVESARRDNRTTLSRLRHQELQLDDARRRAVAEARRKATADKAETSQGRASEAAADAPRVRLRRDLPVEPSQPASSASIDPKRRAVQSQPSAAERRSFEQRSHAKYEARLRDAEAHRAAVEQRNAQRAARGKVVAPLPMPPAASATR